ncbi:hypothetical protein GJ496_010685 [Pomphorhynchus laevis]|nr:hypothetical protein GJ496_010685 [Pomphorhynchus laevis]
MAWYTVVSRETVSENRHSTCVAYILPPTSIVTLASLKCSRELLITLLSKGKNVSKAVSLWKFNSQDESHSASLTIDGKIPYYMTNMYKDRNRESLLSESDITPGLNMHILKQNHNYLFAAAIYTIHSFKFLRSKSMLRRMRINKGKIRLFKCLTVRVQI